MVVLDQFARNVFRGTAKAFAGDGRAQRLASDTVASGEDLQLPWVGRVFMYMPLMHAENLALQEECVRCFTRLATQVPARLHAGLQGNVDFAIQHRDIIARFGRFPHRNQTLGRGSTAAEEEFLRSGPRFGQ